MKNITVQEYKSKVEAGEPIYLLDVREPDEFAEVHMNGTLLPLGQIMSAQIDDIEDWKNEEVVVHCRSGKRSLQACMMLETLGFTNVSNLEGGILAWLEMNGQ